MIFRLILVSLALHLNTAVIDVHLCPHTHDDTGWLKTVDQYYAGLRNNYQNVAVKEIFATLIPELEKDPSRKFTYVEIAFFKRWWDEIDTTMKNRVKKLVAARQLQFINGGWCMNDEAAGHYNAVIDQMTYGHKFLNDTFGVQPNIGWHIDPFGHSSVQASLFAQMGFDAFYFARIDYQDYAQRTSNATLEMMWKGSPNSRKVYSDLFTGVLYDGYGPPPGFCWDIYCGDDKIQNDPALEDYNLDKIGHNFLAYITKMAKSFTTNQLMLTMGSDFQYQGAKTWYDNLDILIKYFKDNPKYGLNVFYSTPADYTTAVNKLQKTYTVKSDDFFPYADGANKYWTGYFVSRAALKKLDRTGNSYLQKCKHFDTLFADQFDLSQAVKTMSEAVGVNQHHDGITGTEKQHVADDYAVRTARGWTMCEDKMNTVLSKVTGTQTMYSQCRLANQSVCAILDGTKSHPYVTMIVYNPIGQADTEYIRLPVDSKPVAVMNSAKKAVPFDFTANLKPYDPTTLNPGLPYTITFAVTAPPAGYTTYFIQFGASDNEETVRRTQASPPSPEQRQRKLIRVRDRIGQSSKIGAPMTVMNNMYEVSFDSTTGRMTSIKNRMNGLMTNVDQKWGWYNASAGFGQNSGAYIFRPNSSTFYPIPGQSPAFHAQTTVVKGNVFQGVTQDFGSFVKQEVRLYNNTNYIEIEYTVGPIPIQDGLGKEIVTKFQTDLKTFNKMYTDSQGRDMQERTMNFRPTWKLKVTEPVAGNYFPLNAYLRLSDKSDNKRHFSVLVDRSQGAGVLGSGETEIMVHRRLLRDDSRGVGEPLNETQNGIGLVIRGKHYIIFGAQNEVTAGYRLESQRLAYEKMLAFTASNSQFATPSTLNWSAIKSLPVGLHLLTLQRWSGKNQVLLRLSHLFEEGENAIFSKPLSVNLKTEIFAHATVVSVVEMSLSANQVLKNVMRMKWNYPGSGATTLRPTLNPQTMMATLNPMDIGTYIVTLQ